MRVLDSVDREIISVMRQNPDATQGQVADRLKLSQPSVAARIRQLKDNGLLMMRVGVDPAKVGLLAAKVEFTAKDPHQVLAKFSNCPCLVGYFVTSGRNNLTLLFVAEKMGALQGIVDHHLRSDHLVEDVNFSLIVSGLEDLAVCPIMTAQKAERTPCGYDCLECPHRKDDGCPGCPATRCYRGTFWAEGRGHRRATRWMSGAEFDRTTS